MKKIHKCYRCKRPLSEKEAMADRNRNKKLKVCFSCWWKDVPTTKFKEVTENG